MFFPGVAKHFQECADWHDRRYGMHPLFGLLLVYQCCIHWSKKNTLQASHRLEEHCGGLHIGGISNPWWALLLCLCTHHFLIIFVGTKFNHYARTWLVLWEGRVVIQLPPWVVVLYPLIIDLPLQCGCQRCASQIGTWVHFEDLTFSDIKFVNTECGRYPTQKNSTPLEAGDEIRRGSLVYFNC